MNQLTSRERLLRALNQKEPDHIPCSFMSFTILRQQCKDNWFDVAIKEQEMGLDPYLFIPTAPRALRKDHPDLRGLPVRFHPKVTIKQWRENNPGGYDYLHKEYITPAGSLSTHIRITEDWPHGDHLPFIDDYQIPRTTKPLITQQSDMEALKFLLQAPQAEDIAKFQQEAGKAAAFANERGILLAGGWGVGMDMVNWLCGMEPLMVLTMEQPDFVSDLLEMVHQWNKQRMQVVLNSPIDIYIRRAWYEGCDFITPRFYRKAILPRLKAEVDLAHEHGKKFGYICSSGTKPMLDLHVEAGIDVLIGIDPIQGTHTDMPLMKQKFADKICLWGGVSGAVTVERGSEVEIREAVRHAIKTLGPKGFILSPVDNLTVDEPLTWKNIGIFIDEWKAHWSK
jgi:uroporphyrinogen-III decarboxylase